MGATYEWYVLKGYLWIIIINNNTVIFLIKYFNMNHKCINIYISKKKSGKEEKEKNMVIVLPSIVAPYEGPLFSCAIVFLVSKLNSSSLEYPQTCQSKKGTIRSHLNAFLHWSFPSRKGWWIPELRKRWFHGFDLYAPLKQLKPENTIRIHCEWNIISLRFWESRAPTLGFEWNNCRNKINI